MSAIDREEIVISLTHEHGWHILEAYNRYRIGSMFFCRFDCKASAIAKARALRKRYIHEYGYKVIKNY